MTAKPGIHLEDHSIAYIDAKPPSLPGNCPLPPHPTIKLTCPPDELSQKGCLTDYSKRYTIEHNFKVAFIGSVAKSSVDSFRQSLNTVLSEGSNQSNSSDIPPFVQESSSYKL